MSNSASNADREISAFINSQLRLRGETQETIQRLLHRSKGYVSERLSGKKSWNIDELNDIAPHFGQRDAIDLVLYAHSIVQSQGPVFSGKSQWNLAAMRDPHKKYHTLGGATAQEDDDGNV